MSIPSSRSLSILSRRDWLPRLPPSSSTLTRLVVREPMLTNRAILLVLILVLESVSLLFSILFNELGKGASCVVRTETLSLETATQACEVN
jgi:hypothetical protein